MVEVLINKINVSVPSSATLLESCEKVGVTIPRFCYHSRLSIAGNCRMCLVQVKNAPKPIASCAQPVMNKMEIWTETDFVRRSRENVLDFLLANHPLDCPICDQGGECDLQDQTMVFGSGRSRFFEKKRKVEDKNFGLFIHTIMSRCIHCTRCVRFLTEVGGFSNFGTTNRGTFTEIGTYVNQPVSSELIGNIVDLCPVGALTATPYAFVGRPWETTTTSSIDVVDGIGTKLRVDVKGADVVRVLPGQENWITDKSRFSFDNLRCFRLDTPFSVKKKRTTWESSYRILMDSYKLSTKKVGFVVSLDVDLVTLEEIKTLAGLLGTPYLFFNTKEKRNEESIDWNHRMTSSIDFVKNKTDGSFFFGCNPRYEASDISVGLQQKSQKQEVNSYQVGWEGDSHQLMKKLGVQTGSMTDWFLGKTVVSQVAKQHKFPSVFWGSSMLENKYTIEWNQLRQQLYSDNTFSREKWIAFQQINVQANQFGVYLGGLLPFSSSVFAKQKVEHLFLVQTDHFQWRSFLKKLQKSLSVFSLYQGQYEGKFSYDISLPVFSSFEIDSFFLNTEGRYQKTTGVCWQSPYRPNTKKFTKWGLREVRNETEWLRFWSYASGPKVQSHSRKKQSAVVQVWQSYVGVKSEVSQKNRLCSLSLSQFPSSFILTEKRLFGDVRQQGEGGHSFLKPIISNLYKTTLPLKYSLFMQQAFLKEKRQFKNFG